MMLRPLRIALAVLIAEIAGVVCLVALVALFGPRDAVAAQQFAERLGLIVGPLTGFLFCLAGGWWAARGSSRPLASGVGVGVTAALLDLGIGVALGMGFAPILLASNVGRVLAGLFGGALAARGATPRNEPATL